MPPLRPLASPLSNLHLRWNGRHPLPGYAMRTLAPKQDHLPGRAPQVPGTWDGVPDALLKKTM